MHSLSIIPHKWEQNGTFWWPPATLSKISIQKLADDSESVPCYDTWKPFKCVVKRICDSLQSARTEYEAMQSNCRFIFNVLCKLYFIKFHHTHIFSYLY